MGHGPHRPGSFGGASVVKAVAGANLEWWLAGSEGVSLNGTDVQLWTDQGSKGRDAGNLTTTKQPFWLSSDSRLNNQPSVVFTYANLDNLFTSAFTLAQPYTEFWVSYLTDTVGPHYLCDGLSSGHRGALACYATPDSYEFLSGGTLWEPTPVIHPVNTAIIHVIEFNGASSKLWVNALTTSFSGNLGTNALDGLRIGAAYDGSSGFQGPIAESIGVSGSMAAADRKAIVSYLSGKYAIAVSA